MIAVRDARHTSTHLFCTLFCYQAHASGVGTEVQGVAEGSEAHRAHVWHQPRVVGGFGKRGPKANIAPGDLLLEINGVDARSRSKQEVDDLLFAAISSVHASFFAVTFAAKVIGMGSTECTGPSYEVHFPTKFGLDFDTRSGGASITRVIVSGITRGGAAASMGSVRKGDQVVALQGKDVRGESLATVLKWITEGLGNATTITFLRDREGPGRKEDGGTKGWMGIRSTRSANKKSTEDVAGGTDGEAAEEAGVAADGTPVPQDEVDEDGHLLWRNAEVSDFDRWTGMHRITLENEKVRAHCLRSRW